MNRILNTPVNYGLFLSSFFCTGIVYGISNAMATKELEKRFAKIESRQNIEYIRNDKKWNELNDTIWKAVATVEKNQAKELPK